MKNIYIIDEHQSSQRNGLGVFVKELLRNLKSDATNITHLDFNTDAQEFTIHHENGIRTFSFPKLAVNPFANSADVLTIFFRFYIPDSADNVFILNHNPCIQLVEAIKKSHPLSKIVFILHDFAWTLNLVGNADRFRESVANRNSSGNENNRRYHRLDTDRRMFGMIDRLVCLSTDTYKMLMDIYEVDRSKLERIVNGLKDSYKTIGEEEKKAIRKNKYIAEDEKIMIYVGRINKIKGGTALLASFAEILKTQPNTRLVVIGNLIDAKNILALGKEISSKITFTGHIAKPEIADWYRIADIGLIPSYIEQCSYSAMEMMMYGLPIVASDGFGVRCMFEEGVNAQVAMIGNRENEEQYTENLTEAILKLLSSDDLRLKLAKASRTVFEARYEVSHMAKKYMKLIESI